jgi:hypothetical protein
MCLTPRDNFSPESQRIFGGFSANMDCMVFVWFFLKDYKNPLRSNTRRIFCFISVQKSTKIQYLRLENYEDF